MAIDHTTKNLSDQSETSTSHEPRSGFRAHDRLGSQGQYTLIKPLAELEERWLAESPRGQCHLRIHRPAEWHTLSRERRDREARTVLKEAERWRGVTVARPRFREVFWEEQALCWVEAPVRGASLASLDGQLSLYEGMSLIEECLCALDLLHGERDFQLGDPLLHLNISPQTIWRGVKGELYLMHPLTPSLIELNAQRKLSDDEALSGEVAPELLRGRYGMNSDLFGLGMSALSAMTGMSISRVDERLQSERLFTHDLAAPKTVIEFLEQLTAFRASARFQSAREALSHLTTLPSLEPTERKYARVTTHAPDGSQSVQTQSGVSPSRSSTTQGTHKSEDHDPSAREDQESQAAEHIPAQSSTHDLALIRDHDKRTQHDDTSSVDDADPNQRDQVTHPVIYEVHAQPSFYVGERPLGHSAAEALGVDADLEPLEGEVISGARWEILWNRSEMRICLILFIVAIAGWSLLQDTSRQRDGQRGLATSETRTDSADPLKYTSRRVESKRPFANGGRSLNAKVTQSYGGRDRPPLVSYLGGEVRGYPRPQWVSVPAGAVIMGSLDDEGYQSERPLHKAKVHAFEVSKTEVTVLQYAQCVTAGMCSTQGLNSTNWGDQKLCNWARIERSNHPLNCVSWHQAKQYAEWVGGRLLSEVEWSYVAQGASAQRRTYPWGDEPASCERAVITDFVRGHGCGSGHTAPVCSKRLGHSPQGLCDLVGNVWEWVMDEWHPNYLGAPDHARPWVDTTLAAWRDVDRVYRGGGAFDERDFPRIARRGGRPAKTHLFNLGFRVARDLPQQPFAPRSGSRTPEETDVQNRPSSGQSGAKTLTD